MYHMNVQASKTKGEIPFPMVSGQEIRTVRIPGASVQLVDEEVIEPNLSENTENQDPALLEPMNYTTR